jgi:hypothetical protein
VQLKRFWPLGLATLTLAAGGVAGTALAGGSAHPNGLPSTGASTNLVPNFSSTTNVAVKAAAVFNSNGTLVRASTKPFGLASFQRLSLGTYDVRFLHNITGCAWFGQVGFGTFAGSTGAAQITITGRAGTNNGLFITTFDGSGALHDEPFMVEVVC